MRRLSKDDRLFCCYFGDSRMFSVGLGGAGGRGEAMAYNRPFSSALPATCPFGVIDPPKHQVNDNLYVRYLAKWSCVVYSSPSYIIPRSCDASILSTLSARINRLFRNKRLNPALRSYLGIATSLAAYVVVR